MTLIEYLLSKGAKKRKATNDLDACIMLSLGDIDGDKHMYYVVAFLDKPNELCVVQLGDKGWYKIKHNHILISPWYKQFTKRFIKFKQELDKSDVQYKIK